jgi:hypothetical protein
MIREKRKIDTLARGAGLRRALLTLWLIALLVATGAHVASAAPKRVTTAKPGNCVACHGSEKVLPQGHEDTKTMTFEACKGCHPKTGAPRLEGKMPGSHLHQLSGVTCVKCHGKAKKVEAVKMNQCVGCHNPDKLVEKTEKVKPENPHTSPHYGSELDCNVCHHQHAKSENFCSQCHKFDFVVP